MLAAAEDEGEEEKEEEEGEMVIHVHMWHNLEVHSSDLSAEVVQGEHEVK